VGVLPQKSLEGAPAGRLGGRGVVCGSIARGVSRLDTRRRGERGYFSVFRSTFSGTSGTTPSLFSAKVAALHKEYCVLAGGVV